MIDDLIFLIAGFVFGFCCAGIIFAKLPIRFYRRGKKAEFSDHQLNLEYMKMQSEWGSVKTKSANEQMGGDINVQMKLLQIERDGAFLAEMLKQNNSTKIELKDSDNYRYPMCKDQLAQIDCRIESCKFYKNAKCTNISPAITLNESKTFVCWSKHPFN